MTSNDYVVLQRGRYNFSDHERDETFALEADCWTCGELLGFNVPIRVEDGRLIEHLSCWLPIAGRERQ